MQARTVETLYFDPGFKKSLKDVSCGPDDADEPDPGDLVADMSCGSCRLMESRQSRQTDDVGVEGTFEYYRNKMEATLQILRNREETLRVQSESLRAAEQRLTEAVQREGLVRDQLDALQRELNELRRQTAARADAAVLAQAADADAEAAARLAEARADCDIVGSLYRDCFYEVAKQQDTIELLRKSYLDIRSMDEQKCRRLGELQQEFVSRRWPSGKYQDIAVEVDNLKLEIMTYLNSTNNDSGVWERCEDPLAAEVAEDLHEILRQLLTLRDVLRSECTCGLAADNDRLRQQRDDLDTQMSQLRKKTTALEEALSEQSCSISRLEDQIAIKHQQVCQLQCQLADREQLLRAAPTPEALEVLRNQLQYAQECVNTKTEELEKVRMDCATHCATIKRLEQELCKAESVIQENCEVRSEVSQLSCQVRAWRAQLATSASRVRELETDLDAARRRCHQLQRSYREKAECAERLQTELAEATERGAELCEESRRVVSALRAWARRVRDVHARQRRRLRDQEAELHELRHRVLAAPTPVVRHHSCCRSDVASARSSQRIPKVGLDQRYCRRAADTRSNTSSPVSPLASTSASPLFCRTQARLLRDHSLPRGESPAQTLMSRVEQLQSALNSGRQRWARAPTRPHTSR